MFFVVVGFVLCAFEWCELELEVFVIGGGLVGFVAVVFVAEVGLGVVFVDEWSKLGG